MITLKKGKFSSMMTVQSMFQEMSDKVATDKISLKLQNPFARYQKIEKSSFNLNER